MYRPSPSRWSVPYRPFTHDFPFTNQLFQDSTVEALEGGDGPMTDINQSRPSYKESESEAMQPLDYSIGSKMIDFLPVTNLDDIPELKPCPFAVVENGQEASDGDEPMQHEPNLIHGNTINNSQQQPNRKSPELSARPDVKHKIMHPSIKSPSHEVQHGMTPDVNGQSSGDEDSFVMNTNTACEDELGESKTSPKSSRRPGRRPGQPSKVYHLWEFLRDLLLNEDYCPTHVHWIDKNNGVFRIAKSEEVAQLWGQKKRTKRSMTYEKMSRAIRFSRAAGYFGPLPKNGDYPKKLCFKFGPRAQDWIEKCSTNSADENKTMKVSVRGTKPTKQGNTNKKTKLTSANTTAARITGVNPALTKPAIPQENKRTKKDTNFSAEAKPVRDNGTEKTVHWKKRVKSEMQS